MKLNIKTLLAKWSFPVLVSILIMAMFFNVLSCKKAIKTCKEPVNTELSSVDTLNIADSLTKMYNYSKNKSSFELTFLEFGSVGCIECKKMEKVLKEIKTNYKGKVNVVFYNARNKETKKIFKHFGIQLIPVQVLLDKNGKEYFRHVGYYSTDSLTQQIILK
jgi:thioredoxin 1